MNISEEYKTGDITIDQDCVIQYGKGEYYGNLMDEGVNNLIDKIHAEDIPVVKYAINQLETREISSVAIRMESEEGYDWIIAIMSYSTVNYNEKKLIDISLQNVIQSRDDDNRFYHTLIDEDPGTGLLNKRAITEYAVKLIDQEKVDYNVTIAIIDIDDFKTVNDTFGHSFGDEVLVKVAGIVKDAIGDKGVAGRIGGDEMFIVLLGMENEDQTRSILKEIRTNIEWAYKGDKSRDIVTTCSIGSATYPMDASSYAELFNIADKLLYLAKEKGKNRYIIYEDDVHRQYVKGTGEVVMRVKDTIKYNKRSIVLDIMNRFMINDELEFDEICKRVGPCFELEDISIYTAPDWKRAASWGIFNDRELDISYVNNPDYMKYFDKYNMFIIDGPLHVRERCQQLYEVLIEQQISASVHYLVGTIEQPKAIITYSKSKLAKKWASWDIDWLCMLSRMIELKVFGK